MRQDGASRLPAADAACSLPIAPFCWSSAGRHSQVLLTFCLQHLHLAPGSTIDIQISIYNADLFGHTGWGDDLVSACLQSREHGHVNTGSQPLRCAHHRHAVHLFADFTPQLECMLNNAASHCKGGRLMSASEGAVMPLPCQGHARRGHRSPLLARQWHSQMVLGPCCKVCFIRGHLGHAALGDSGRALYHALCQCFGSRFSRWTQQAVRRDHDL